ncbi:MAG: DUF1292 domain-containing protein [Bacilli bacterium]
MTNRINTLITLDDGKKYAIINQAVYKGKSYLLVNAVNDEETDLLEDVQILEEKKDINGDMAVDQVEDPALLELLAKYLAPKE